ncbi:calsyntenin-1-like [Paramacrobiotus metropolitanus]|uniref:calsyntenin-1-like n=1 Tax=Paramacrobiotus metropolitanus TaxID=2943436 RepID=UPI00244612D8|nr:calsyntenin-1-like [Paramacrobiotus metropolitanus]
MAWSSRMYQLYAAVGLCAVLVFLAAQECDGRVPKFAIGKDFHTYYAQYSVDSPSEPHDIYRAYIKENSRELLVEPRIYVLAPSATDSQTDADDVCEYKIVPPVRVAAADALSNTTSRPGNSEEDDEITSRSTVSSRSSTSSQPSDEDYNDEDDDEEEEDEPEPLPFIIRPSKENKHEAIIETSKALNCEHKMDYVFDIVAVSCAGDVSESARVEVKVEDVNEFEPKFSRNAYEATMEEGRLVDNILQVEAFDADCSEEFSRIAKYEISDPINSPFTIDNTGVIRNLRPLNYTQERKFFLSIIAYDAAGKKSVYPATVNINVIPVCTPHWKVNPQRVDYAPDTAMLKLYPNAQLDLCETSIMPGSCSKIEKITAHVTLKNDHIGKGCDREDQLPLQVQRKRCASRIQPHSNLIELLPNPITAQADSNLKMDRNNSLPGSNVLYFDGTSTAIVVPSQKLNPDHFNRSFTITTWLKRDAPVNRTTYDHKFAKEHVLCISDDRERSRHHVAVYIRNCRLALLLRREPRAGDQPTVFRPAEWRWNLDNYLCTGEWHHYAISVKYPDVKLFIDGKEFDDDSATEIIDDWALHPIKGLQTTTVVGACWQGSQSRMDQYLHGYLDGLSLLVNETEEESVLQCMNKCAERLTLPPSTVSSSERAVFSMLDGDENELMVEGYDTKAFQDLINQIGYENDRMYPAAGVRFVDLRTTFTCAPAPNDGNTTISLMKDLPDVRLTLKVTEAVPPTVTLSGPSTLTIDGMDNPQPDVFRMGVKILDSLTISVMRASSPVLMAQEQKTSLTQTDYEAMVRKFERDVVLLDSCTIRLKNERAVEGVTLNVSEGAVRSAGMVVQLSQRSTGEMEWVIKGSGVNNEVPEFLNVLRDIRLKLDEGKISKYNDLRVKVAVFCTEMFSKFPSVEYILEVDLKNFEHLEKLLMHPVQIPTVVHRSLPKAQLQAHNEHVQLKEPVMLKKHEFEALYGPHSVFSVPQFHTGSDVGHMSSTGAAITVVVVICVSFFIFIVFIGVLKLRSIHLRSRNTSEPDLQAMHNRKKKSKVSLKNLRKLRKSLSSKSRQCENHDFDDEDDMEDDLERGTASKQKPDMKWDDEGMSITVNPLEVMQAGSEGEYEDDVDNEEDYHVHDDDLTDEEKEHEDCHHGHVLEDEDSANECEECSKPNRCDMIVPQSPTIRRSQSCTEAFAKSKDSRIKTDLEWDDNI